MSHNDCDYHQLDDAVVDNFRTKARELLTNLHTNYPVQPMPDALQPAA